MKRTQTDHAIRALSGSSLSVMGNVIQFTFPDGSITSIQIEEGERDKTCKEYFEQALKWVDKLKEQGMITEHESCRIGDRIVKQYQKIRSK